MAMENFSGTSIVGGVDGDLSSDLYFMNGGGAFVLNDDEKNTLDMGHPIKKIDISCGWIVDGVSITYQTTGGCSSKISHGTVFKSPTATVSLGKDEIISAVFGRAGPQSFYKREMINNIGFVIFDTVKGITRVEGPFGNGDNTSEGMPFYISDVVAFGSISKSNPTAHLSLCGLFFFKKRVDLMMGASGI